MSSTAKMETGKISSIKELKNYSKNSSLNQVRNKMKNEEIEKKVKFFIEKLPSYVRAFKTKGKFNRKRKIPIEKALREYKFIEFNLQTANFLIVDIDHREISVNEIFETLRERNILPTYIVFTDRGYQIGWELEHPFITNPKFQTALDAKLEKYSRYILKKLTYLLKGDTAAVRVKGVWRNPVTNKSKIYYSKKYLLNELDIYIREIDERIGSEDGVKFHINGEDIKNKVARILIDKSAIDEVVVGERNSVLWYIGMFMGKEILRNKELTSKEKYKAFSKNVKEELLTLNSMLRTPLSKKEVLQIFKSVKRYFKENRIIVSFGKYENWTNEVKRKYMKIYRLRKGITRFSRRELKRNNLVKVAYALASTSNTKEAIKQAGLGKTTFYKYYKLLQSQSKLFFFVKLLVCLQKTNTSLEKAIIEYAGIFFEIIYSSIKSIFRFFKDEVPLLERRKFDNRRLIFKNSLLASLY